MLKIRISFTLKANILNFQIKGMNSIFGLKNRLAIGEQTIIAIAVSSFRI